MSLGFRFRMCQQRLPAATFLFLCLALAGLILGCGGNGGGTPAPAPLPPAITTSSLAPGMVGVAYTASLEASGGTAPYTFAVTSGTLPAGLALASDGQFSGTPTTAGEANLGFTVTDAAGLHAAATLTLVISPAVLDITTTALPADALNTAYSQTLAVTGGTAPYTFSVASGTLPPGVTLSSSGVLAGTPTAAGAFVFTVTVADSSAPMMTGSAALTLNVYTATVQVNPSAVVTTVPATAYGLHTSVYDSALADVTGLPAVLATDGIAMLRYPGGLYSDNYHWAQYTVTPFFAPAAPACGKVQNGFLAGNTDFGSFVKTLQATATQAIITINYGTSVADASASKTTGSYGIDDCSEPNTSGQPQEAAAWVAYANGSASSTQAIGVDAAGFDWKTVGFWASLRGATPLTTDDGYNFLRIGQTTPLGVKYWELGNELFYNGYSDNVNSETDLHAPYLYPDGDSGAFSSRIGVAPLSPTAYGTNVIPFIHAMKAVDPTIQLGLVLSSPNVDPTPASWNPAAIQAVCAGASFDFGIFHYYPGTFQGSTAGQLLSLPQSDLPSLVSGAQTQIAKYCPGTSTPVQFFVTETGPNPSLATGTPAEVLGLFSANVYLAAFSAGAGNVDWLEMHNNTGFLTYANSTETPGPAFYGIELAHLLAEPRDELVAATASGSKLVAYASAKANGHHGVLLINADAASPATVLVTVSGASLSGMATEYRYGVGSTPTEAALGTTSFSVSGNSFVVTVPAYTATTVVFP